MRLLLFQIPLVLAGALPFLLVPDPFVAILLSIVGVVANVVGYYEGVYVERG